MKVKRDDVTRQEVIRFYAKYDQCKKGGLPPPSDMEEWNWDDPRELDRRLKENKLKDGVLETRFLHGRNKPEWLGGTARVPSFPLTSRVSGGQRGFASCTLLFFGLRFLAPDTGPAE